VGARTWGRAETKEGVLLTPSTVSEPLTVGRQLVPGRALGRTARDDGGARVVAKVEAVADAAGDGQDVLERAAQLNAWQWGGRQRISHRVGAR
jgi:hypothetical protein